MNPNKKIKILFTVLFLILVAMFIDYIYLLFMSRGLSGSPAIIGCDHCDSLCEKILVNNNIKRLKFYDPDKYRTYITLADCYNYFGRYNEAISIYYKTLKYSPNDFAIYQLIGECYMSLGKYGKAILSFKKALDTVDSNNWGYASSKDDAVKHINYKLGLAYVKNNDKELAMHQLKKIQAAEEIRLPKLTLSVSLADKLSEEINKVFNNR